MNKKGFTLVEILAVMVILIIVILIALTRVRKTVDKSADQAIVANAGVVIKAVNDAASNVNIMQQTDLKNGVIMATDLASHDISITGTKPDSGYVMLENYEVVTACLVYDGYKIEYNNGKFTDPEKGECSFTSEPEVFAYTGNYETFTAQYSGKYKVQLWGAAAGTNDLSGKGGYTEGLIKLNAGDKLYVYVGEMGSSLAATFNGGGACTQGCTPGGGATDVRLVSGTWSDTTSLASRIMVAGGGGGYNAYSSGSSGGYAGGLEGRKGYGRGTDNGPYGGSQISGGDKNNTYNNANSGFSGTFGIGGNSGSWGGGGGGGYYGGGGGSNNPSIGGGENGGGGGSSYISGHEGCIAIISDTNITPKAGCSENTTKECSIHYSTKYFTDTVMRSGNQSMPKPDDPDETIIGNNSSGYAKITLVGL